MGEWITTINGLITLIISASSLIGMGITAFFSIKAWIKARKEKTAAENWQLIQVIADSVMKEVEKSGLAGASKKELAINMIKEGCKAAGLDLGPFIDQLSSYIDNCVTWYNGMTAATKAVKKASK